MNCERTLELTRTRPADLIADNILGMRTGYELRELGRMGEFNQKAFARASLSCSIHTRARSRVVFLLFIKASRHLTHHNACQAFP